MRRKEFPPTSYKKDFFVVERKLWLRPGVSKTRRLGHSAKAIQTVFSTSGLSHFI
jgi:hypothetical protein